MSGYFYAQNASLKTRISSTVGARCGQRKACLACQKVTEMDRRIEYIRRELRDALEERDKLVSFTDVYHDSVHDQLLTRLPVEVVSTIFLECRPIIPDVHDSAARYDYQSYAKEVLKLGHVCKTWRQIAHTTPRLWTILVASVTEINCESMVPLVSEWVGRSGTMPLFVQIAFDLDDISDDEPLLSSVHQLFASIIHHAERWHAFDISMPSSFSSWVSSALSSKSLNQLDVLKTHITTTSQQDLRLEVSPRIWNSRQNSIWQVSINLSRLTQFNTDVVHIEDLLDLLRNAPHLCCVRVDDICDDFRGSLGEPVLAQSLQTLNVTTSFNEFFRYVNPPALHTLHISHALARDSSPDDEFDDDLQQWTPVANMIQRTGCKLRELRVHKPKSSSSQWGRSFGEATAAFLVFASSLQRLILEGAIMQGDFLDGLAEVSSFLPTEPESSVRPFLPHLQLVHCSTPSVYFNSLYLISFLEGLACHSTLQQFTLQYTKWPEGSMKNFRFDLLRKRLMEATRKAKVHILDGEGRDLVERPHYLNE